MAESATILIPAVLFLATLIRSVFGFGEALVAAPLLALMAPVETAAPLAVLVSITVASIVLASDWRKVHIRSAGWLLFPTFFGIPVGLLLVKTIPQPAVKGTLAVLIISFSAYSLLRSEHRELKDDRYAWLFGFTAGVLGGAYGMNGPPLVLYGFLRRWSPQHFRATLQGYFLPASGAALWGYHAAGIWTPAVGQLYLQSLPLILLATLLGRVINARIALQRFVIYLHGGLIAIGAILLLQALKT